MPSDQPQYGTTWTNRDFDFTTPSGSLCRLRKMDPLELVEAGLLEKLDFVTTVVSTVHIPNAKQSPAQRAKAQRAKAEKTEEEIERELTRKALDEVSKDPSKVGNLRRVLDEVACRVVVAPSVHPAPRRAADREDGLIYADMIPFNDKMAIFNAVMKGVKTAEQFREESGEPLGDVASEPSVSDAPKRRPRAKKN